MKVEDKIYFWKKHLMSVFEILSDVQMEVDDAEYKNYIKKRDVKIVEDFLQKCELDTMQHVASRVDIDTTNINHDDLKNEIAVYFVNKHYREFPLFSKFLRPCLPSYYYIRINIFDILISMNVEVDEEYYIHYKNSDRKLKPILFKNE